VSLRALVAHVALTHSLDPSLQVRVSSGVINQDPPASCSSNIIQAVTQSAEDLGLGVKHMVSRAYHDSLFMAR
jgi:ureidoglycolate amidohydrolase